MANRKAIQRGGGNICPVTRDEFHGNAKAMSCKIGDVLMNAGPREFSTGTLGWYGKGDSQLSVGDKDVDVTIQISVFVKKSKQLP
jgi:hypothetical protein